MGEIAISIEIDVFYIGIDYQVIIVFCRSVYWIQQYS